MATTKQNFEWEPGCFVAGDSKDGRYGNSRADGGGSTAGYWPRQRAGDSSRTRTHEDNALSHI